MSQLTTNTTTIDELITLANNLPDAGSEGSGGNVETCTVTIEYVTSINENGFIPEGVFSALSNGMFVPIIVSDIVEDVEGDWVTGPANQVCRKVIQQVIKGTSVVLTNQGMDWEYGLTVSGNVEILECNFGLSLSCAFQIKGDCQISFAVA